VIAPSPNNEDLLVGIGRELFTFDKLTFDLVLQLPSAISSLYAGPYQLWLTTDGGGLFDVAMDNTPQIYWDSASQMRGYPDRFGYQALTMSDMRTLWVGSTESGLIRLQAAFGQ